MDNTTADDLQLDLARALAELTRDIVAGDFIGAEPHLAEVRDRIERLAARQRAATGA